MRASTPVTVLLAAVLAAAAAACSSGGSTPASPSPVTGGSQTPAATTAGIDHPTGPTDVVLRFDEAGGFVPVEVTAGHVPYFTLYGDGRIVFVRTGAPVEPSADGLQMGQPLRTARMTEEQVQALLEFALGDGGLGVARAEYQNPLVADAPTAVFEVHAGGLDKTVSVVALGMDSEPGVDSQVKAALAGLGERLRDFDQGGSLSSDAFTPAAYRAVLIDQGGGAVGAARPWPWPSIGPDDFSFPADPNALRLGQRVVTPDDVAALGIEGSENGVQAGLSVSAPGGGVYSLVIRPLLPDEQA